MKTRIVKKSSVPEKRQRRQRPFRSVRHEGGSVVITLGRDMIPDDWGMVKLTVLAKNQEKPGERPYIVLKIERVS